VAKSVAISIHLALFVTLPLLDSSSLDGSVVGIPEDFSWQGSDFVARVDLDQRQESVVLPAVSAPISASRPRPPDSPVQASVEESKRTPILGTGSAPPLAGSQPLRLFSSDGRPLLPKDSFGAVGSDSPSGYTSPGGRNEDSVFYRPVALDPGTTRFAQAWIERGNLLDDSVNRLVESGTATLSVKLNQKFSLVCKVAVVGVAGVCVVERDGGSQVVIDRPQEAPWEKAKTVQCRELRSALDAADTAQSVAAALERLAAICGVPQ
jgi:hypothetical protein